MWTSQRKSWGPNPAFSLHPSFLQLVNKLSKFFLVVFASQKQRTGVAATCSQPDPGWGGLHSENPGVIPGSAVGKGETVWCEELHVPGAPLVWSRVLFR